MKILIDSLVDWVFICNLLKRADDIRWSFSIKEYQGIGKYTTFLDCINKHIGSRLYRNEMDNNNNDDGFYQRFFILFIEAHYILYQEISDFCSLTIIT